MDYRDFPGAPVILNGYFKIVNFLAKGLQIRLNTNVHSISRNTKTKIAQISTNNGTFYSNFVISTVPVPVYQKNLIAFHPPLPEFKMAAINRIQIGTMNKIVFVFENAFWKDQVSEEFIGISSDLDDDYIHLLNLEKHFKAPILVFFIYGDVAKEEELRSDVEIKIKYIHKLAKVFPNVYDEKIVDFHFTRWSHEVSGGSYTINAGKGEDLDILALPVDNMLFFGGESSCRDYHGTVHGGFLAGQRAAKEVLQELKKQPVVTSSVPTRVQMPSQGISAKGARSKY